ncbi:MAG: recombination mediator RecR [Patescibacteria group bacterium]|jgi:recombination protein RecR
MLPKSVQNLIDEFSKLPGVGPKTAARLVFYLLSKSSSDIESLGKAVLDLKNNLHFCVQCYNIAEDDLCLVCRDSSRNSRCVAVVEEPLDVIALEKTGGFGGLYHVLGGAISPIEGIGPENLRVQQLIDRLAKDGTDEVILATDPDFEGEATAAYVKDRIKELNLPISVTRIARGLPVGSNIEYADEVTIKRSLEGRREY